MKEVSLAWSRVQQVKLSEWVETVGSKGGSRDELGGWERRLSTKVNVNEPLLVYAVIRVGMGRRSGM